MGSVFAWVIVAAGVAVIWLFIEGIDAMLKGYPKPDSETRCKCCWCEEERRGH